MSDVIDRAFAQTDEAIAIARDAMAEFYQATAKLEDVTAQRDVLLAALKNLWRDIQDNPASFDVWCGGHPHITAAREAIEKAEGNL
jgi:hypothetical protein